MLKHSLRFWLVCGVLSIGPAAAWAGMPTFVADESTRHLVLSESGRLRFETISFFVAALLTLAVVVRWLWNRLRLDFPRMPRLGFGQALGIVAAWGLLFLVVLTMIAAARETMTPGVWQKQGLLYSLPAGQAARPAPRVQEVTKSEARP